MIQQVEEFRPELRIEVIRDLLDVVILEEREIKIDESWPDQRVAAKITPKSDWGWNAETLCPYVMNWIP